MEGDRIGVVPVPEPVPAGDVAFADGIQRYIVEGRVGMVPIVRAHVGAAVLRRRDRTLAPAGWRAEEFLVAPLERLPPRVVQGLHDTGFPVVDCGSPERER